MKALLAALAAFVVFTASYAGADHLHAETVALVRWAGCTAPVFTSDLVPVWGSFYVAQDSIAVDESGIQFFARGLYIGTLPGVPIYAQTIVTLHETGHCLQHQAGYLDQFPQVERELDADRLSADLACGYGLPGRWLLHETLAFFHRVFGYLGDPFHGTLLQRIQAGQGASRCHEPSYEAA